MTKLKDDVHRQDFDHLSMLWIACALISVAGTLALNIAIALLRAQEDEELHDVMDAKQK